VAGQARMVVGRPAHVAIALPLCPKGVVVEPKREIVVGKGGKEGEGGSLANILLLTSHAWPPLNPYFHPPLHLAPIMLTPVTKIIKSKANSIHPFPKFFLKLDFILCYDEINMLTKGINKNGG
jgi:hypothetical protein